MQMSFGFRLLLSIVIGALGDGFAARFFAGERSAYHGLGLALGLAAALSFLSLPFIWRCAIWSEAPNSDEGCARR